MGKNNDLGLWGERQAARFLIRKGLRLLEHSYRCRRGEIDLIMEDGDELAFVEVKLRRSDRYGAPAEYVTAVKRERLRAAASHYLQSHKTEKQPRFDVVEVYAPKGMDTDPIPVRHIPNAFW